MLKENGVNAQTAIAVGETYAAQGKTPLYFAQGETMLGVIAAAEEMRAPIILQCAETRLKHHPLKLLGPLMIAAAKTASVPVAVHLDHGTTIACVQEALDLGFTSVMIDGSHSPLEGNIAVTRAVVDVAHPCGIPVEAELGKVGGKEDDLESDGCGYTDPADAVRFVAETGIDSLAVAIGTAHGVYTGTPVLDVDRLRAIRRVVEMALDSGASTVVLAHNHPSGIAIPSDEDIHTTCRIAAALDCVDIHLADHIVVADEDYVSMVQSGCSFSDFMVI